MTDKFDVEKARELSSRQDDPDDRALILQSLDVIAERDAIIEKQREALDNVPLPSSAKGASEFYGRFYSWLDGECKAALSLTKPEKDDG